jgi:hypothetical protein
MMNTAIMLSLLLVSGIVLVISEGNKLFSKSSERYAGLNIPVEKGDSREDANRREESNLFPNDENNRVNLLDFSGGTLGI